MDQTAQGGLGGCQSETCGDQPLKEEDNWSHSHPPTTNNLQPWPLSHPQTCVAPLHWTSPPFTLTIAHSLYFAIHWLHSDVMHAIPVMSHVIHCHTHLQFLEMVFLKSCQFVYQLRKIKRLKCPGYLVVYCEFQCILRYCSSTLTSVTKLFILHLTI